MGVTLTGEYEITNDGVSIGGKITGSHIWELNKVLKPMGNAEMFAGINKTEQAPFYKVPHPKFRRTLIDNGLLCYEDEKPFTKSVPPERLSYGIREYWKDGSVMFNWMGVQYSPCDGTNLIESREILSFNGKSHRVRRLITNSAWVWCVNEDGTFEVKLHGLVNRHIMTVIIGHATKFAKYLEMVAMKTIDKSDTLWRS